MTALTPAVPEVPLAPNARTLAVTIVGAGFGGIGMAVRLAQAGIDDITVLERADRVGGVWAANSYPGAACDIPASLYSFSFAPKADWTRRYPPQEEIQAYLHDTAERFGVLPRIRFGTEVRSAQFDEAAARWVLDLADGGTHECDVLITACGQLSRPAIPAIPGREEFAGVAFHSATWRHDHDLTGRRVAVVGTGASAIQFLPHVAEQAAHTTLFQLDAPHVIPKPDRPYPPWLRTAFRRVPGLLRLNRAATYVQYEMRAVAFTKWTGLMRLIDGQARRHLRRQVGDPALREAVAPQGEPGCKRILLSNDYYPALTRPSVEVVRTPISRVLPDGLRTDDGVVHPVDTIIWGTGFAATDFLTPMTVTGPGGRDLREAWADGAEAYLGIAVAGFPNLFLLYGPNTNLGHNSIVYMLESQIRYVVQAVRRVAARPAALSVRPEVQRRFNEWVQDRITATVWDRGCTSWYRTASGRNTTNWPDFTFAYRARTRRFDEADYELTPVAR
ncbi:NAD(P)/FAD-dependent oxidoreductase [Blastococcus jejuensis]|uniref:NAD(P)/FAD-dependent oxidoreductase n=1 Tax=Blastococcus jejuensis TaxID=351224 RepID=A0ABP6P9S4_9ACTN